MCGDWHQADDLTQTALVRLYVAWPRVTRRGTEDAYVRRILLNASIDASRRGVRRETPTADVPERAAPDETSLEDRTSLVAALQTLPAQQRATVLLRHWLGLSVSETAAEPGHRGGHREEPHLAGAHRAAGGAGCRRRVRIATASPTAAPAAVSTKRGPSRSPSGSGCASSVTSRASGVISTSARP
nr:sigma factor [Nocardioides convexus]